MPGNSHECDDLRSRSRDLILDEALTTVERAQSFCTEIAELVGALRWAGNTAVGPSLKINLRIALKNLAGVVPEQYR